MSKITLPHRKQVYRVIDNKGYFIGSDVVTLAFEQDVEIMHHPMYKDKSLSIAKYKKEPLLEKVMEGGIRLVKKQSLSEIAQYSMERLKSLPEEYKRFNYPHIYKVGLSTNLLAERDKLIAEHKL